MSSLKNRVMALALSVLTAVTTCAGTVPAWAETVQTENVASTSEKQTAETVVINVKIDNAGGSVAVGNDSDKKTIQMQDDGTVKTTDAEGNETVAAIDNTHPYALTLTETKGAKVPVTAAASDGYEVSTYTITIDGGSEDAGFVSGNTFSYNLTADQDKTIEVDFAKKDEAQAQTETTATTAPAAEDEQIDTSAYDDMDFTSARLLVGTDDASVVEGDQEYILSSYDGLYLIQYPDVRSAKEAYAGYAKTADFVDIDNATLSAADDADITDVTAASAMTQDSNPLTELANAPTEKVKKGTIALIDTGASQEGNVTEAVSMLGDDASDDNGHGSQMVQYITEEDPDAKILSIKALDANGNGTPSSVTAAIHYAMERKVSVINLSLSGTKTAESSAVEEAVKEAVNAGITVIGAAGNNGKNAKYYIPGEIAEAVIVGSVDREGKKISSSNYGDTVDYYVVSASTSEAAARLSGIFSKEGKIEADDKTIFTTAATESSKTDEDNTDSTSGGIKAANGGSGSTGATGGGGIGNVHGFYVWYDAGKSANVRVDKNTTVADQNVIKKADAFRTKAIEHNAMSGVLSTINDSNVENYRSLYNKAAVEALKDAASRSNTSRARIVGAIGIYTIGSDGSTAFPIHDFPETPTPLYYGSWQELTNMRADNGSGLPDSLSWNSVHYNNGQATKQNWRQWLYEYGLNKVRSSKVGFVGTTVIVYAVAEDEPTSKVYAQIHKSGSNGDTIGAQYEIWYDGKGTAGGGKGTGKSFIIGKNGISNTVELEPGHTYYYHEFIAPSNGNYTLDDTWYQFSADQIKSHTDANNPLILKTSDTPYVYLRIHKTGTEAAESTAGAEYEIWYDGKGGADGGKGTGLKFTIGNDGYSNVVKVEPGHTYYYHEFGTPSNGNYLLDDTWYKVTADQIKDHTSNSNPLVVNTSDTPKTYVYLTKASSNTDVTHNNRCYSLKDGVFELTNAKTGKTYTVTTDENGNTPTIQVEIGTYHVTEKTAPHGYRKNTNIPDIEITEDNVKNNPYHIQVQDIPDVDPLPILLQKRDAETGKGTPQGAGSLAGAQYTVKYYDVQNGDEASLKDETPLRTWVLATNKIGKVSMLSKYKISGDDFYMADGLAGIPIGTILIQETKAPDGYQLNNQVYAVHFNPDENGNVIADVTAIYADNDAADEVKALESPQRGGLNFLKYDTSNKPMAGIPFVITSETTGESHVIIADANGRVNTEANKHSNNTNGNDSLIRKTAEGAYVCDDPSKLDANAGIWFGEAPADDSKMALLFDKYTINEVFVKNLNYGKNISNVRKNDTKENKAGSVLGVVIDTNGKNVSLDPEVWENPDVKLGTTAKNADIDSKNIALTDTATVVDTVSYENLTPGDAYILKGKLVDKDNPTVAVAEAQASFTPSQKNGTVNVTFHFSASNLEGKTLVAFEYLNWKGIEIAKHEETGDTSQTVYVPKLRTTLTDQSVEDEVGVKSKEDTFVDAVQYWNLAPHENFLIKGQLIQKSTGKVLATADSGEFSVGAKSMDGTKNVIFKFDSTGLAGETVVAYEKLYHVSDDGDLYELDQHENLEDTAQSVYFPKIGTTAKDGQTSDHVGTSGKSAKLVDTVKLNNVVVGKEYAVRGTLMNKQTGEPVLENGKKITAEGTVTFDASGKAKVTGSASNAQGVLNAKNSNHSVDGSVDLTFTFNSSVLEGQTVVAFEDLLHKNIEVDTHSDIRDEDQSVHYPKVGTSAKDGYTQDSVGTIGAKATIVDTVKLENLVTGMTYTVNGILKDQKTGADFTVNGKTVTQSADITVNADGTLTAKNKEKVTAVWNKDQNRVDGTVDLTFTFDSSAIAGTSVVAFESLQHNKVTVAAHSDIKDEGQTTHYPKIQTTATDQKTGDHVGTIFGEMINKVRAMLGDEDVSGDGIKDSREQTIVDHVKLENLALGKEYTVSGVLMDQSTGKAIEIDGKQVTQTAVITTSADGKITAKNGEKTSVTAYDAQNHRVDGYVDLTYKLDSSKLVKYGSESENGAAIVVFEDLIHNGVTVNVHHDISDAGQTVGDVGIHTTAVDSRTGDHVGDSPRKAETHSSVADEKETVITDTVNMTKLVQGAEYTVKGYLVVQDASSKDHPVYLKADGNTTSNKSEAISAAKTFTADEKNMQSFTKQANSLANGSVALSFPVKSSLVSGKTIVVFEDLYHNNVKISTHSDISDENQSVHYPDVKTSAIDKDTKDDVGTVHKNAVIVDTVQLTNLVPGKSYTVNGTLHDQKSGDIFKDADGNAVTQKAEITISADGKNITAKNGEKVTVTKTGDAVSGTVDLTFTFDSSLLAGKTLVAFEDLEHNGVKVATHSNIYDESQSEHYPEIHTTAVDKTTGDHVGSIFGALINGLRKMFGQTDADGNGIADDRQQNIVDTVTLANLVPGKSYVVSGKLMDAETGKAVVIDGKEVTASTVITASENGISSSNGCKTVFDNFDSTNHDVDGSVELTFTLDSSKIQGVETVVFERLYHADGYTSDTQTPDWEDETHLINRHEDTNDDGQSVSEVGIHTTAVDLATGNDQGVVPNSYVTSSVIEDTVELAKLVPGQAYQIRGRLVDLTDSDFENGKVVYLKSDGSATDNIDEAVTVTSDEFEAQASEETHKLQLTVSGSLVQGKDVTVFEDILHNGIVISSHPAKNTPETWDKEEFKSQTVHYMTGKTNATDGVENIHSTVADGTRTIEDKVYFQNLLVGKTYSVEGTLHDKATGEALTDEGATRKVTFTAAEDLAQAAYDNDETEQTAEPAKVSDLKVMEHFDGTKTISGYVTLTFTVDASELAGQTLVAFEKFTNEGKEIFVHEDLEDLPQTIKIPKIGTTAKAGELDETALYNEDGTPKEITITDTVSYENLWTKELLDKLHEEGLAITDNGITVPSDHTPVYDINETGEYTMTGKLIDKATGKAITDVNGNEYESSVHFVPDAENGTVDVTFTLNAADFIDKDGNCTLDGKSIVVYEDLYQVPEGEETSEDNHTAVHHDVDDQEQDIRFPKGRTHATDYTDGKLTQEELSALTQEDLAKIAADHESEVDIDSNEAEATDTMKILDMVSYSNLHAATEYTVTGALQTVTERDENGKAVKWEPALDDDGKEITQTVTFTTPEDEDGQDSVSGYVPVLFTFKGVSLAGKTTVAFEKFTREEQDVMVHHDINDTPQTDYIPSIHTNATSAVTGNHNGVVGKDYIIDEVSYENLEEGRTYSLHAQLMDKATGKAVDNVTIEGSFVAGTENQFISKDGTVISTMEDVRKQLKAETDGASHEALNGKAVKPVKENPTETPTEEKELAVSAAEVGNGIAKGTYVVTPNEWTEGKWGFVHVYDKDPADGGKLVLAADVNDQNPETAITLSDGQFLEYFNVSLKKNSKVEVPSYDGTQMQEIYDADMKALKAADIQTDKTVEETEEKEADTDVTVDHPADPEKETAADEAVTSSSVEEEKDAVTAASETEETEKAADQTAKEAETGVSRVSGSVYVIIPVDASKLGGHTLVAFEKLYTNPENGTPKEIAHHEDINDEAQSVHYIEIHTTATDKKDGDKTLATSGTVTVNDKVSFKNLIPGKKYKVSGTLMDKKTGEALVVGGKKVTSENTFTPNAANGSINMEFTFDVTSVASGDYVVFEKLYDAESKAEIAKHEDINDKSQTVTVPTRPEIQTSDRPMSPVLPIAAGVAVVAILAAVLLGRKKKTDKK